MATAKKTTKKTTTNVGADTVETVEAAETTAKKTTAAKKTTTAKRTRSPRSQGICRPDYEDVPQIPERPCGSFCCGKRTPESAQTYE